MSKRPNRRRSGRPRETTDRGVPHASVPGTHAEQRAQLDVTPATTLPAELRQWAIERGADTALATGQAAVVVGLAGDYVMVCVDGCCVTVPGTFVIVPDVLVAEMAANGAGDGSKTMQLHRADGRVCRVYAAPGGE